MQDHTTAQRLKLIMKERDLKQTDIIRMAEPYCTKYRIKLGKSDMSQFVSGKAKPGQWKLSILAMALNVSEAWLMGLDVPMERGFNDFEPSIPWSNRFRNAIKAASESVSYADYEAACIDPEQVDSIISDDKIITLDQACELADSFGISLDLDVLERDTPIQQDERTSEVIRLFGSLDQTHQETLLHVLRGLLADQKISPGSRGKVD